MNHPAHEKPAFSESARYDPPKLRITQGAINHALNAPIHVANSDGLGHMDRKINK
jgi:hypothetical protein